MRKIPIGAYILYFLIFILVVSYLNPYLSMRRFILFDNPKAAFTAKINSIYHKDHQYGHCYNIQGWKDPATQNYLDGICVERKFIFYVVTSHGSG